MLFVLFQLGQNRYALDARQVAEVLPLVVVTQIPQAPAAVAGVFNYRGAPVPAIDLSQLTLGRPVRRRLNTRIVLVHYPDVGGAMRLLGLIAERATETLRREPADFTASGGHERGRALSGSRSRGLARTDPVDRGQPPAAGVGARAVVPAARGAVMVHAEFEGLLKQTMGLNAASIGSAAIERAVQVRLSACALDDARAYWELVRASTTELQALIETVVVPETWFFRDREAFAALAHIALHAGCGHTRKECCAC